MNVLGIDSQTKGIALACISREDQVDRYWWLPITEVEVEKRLAQVSKLLESFATQPDVSSPIAYVERPPYVKSYLTLLRLAQVQGATIACLAGQGSKIVEVDPATWKAYLTGYGHATKQQVKEMAMTRLSLEDNLPQDIYDACGIALAGFMAEKWKAKVARETVKNSQMRARG